MIQQYKKDRMNSIRRQNFSRHTGLKPAIFPSLHGSCPWKQTEVSEMLRVSCPCLHRAVASYNAYSPAFTSPRTYLEGPNEQQRLTPAPPPAELNHRPVVLPPSPSKWGEKPQDSLLAEVLSAAKSPLQYRGNKALYL